jgi:8-oxo-dGTP pyrophosphatase MutT (NUDIX family)
MRSGNHPRGEYFSWRMDKMKSEKEDNRSWKIIRSEPGPELILFKTHFDWLANPRNQKVMRAVILEARDWVNVIALTPRERIVTVSQFRFGIRQHSLEIPAGLVDPGEAPLQAAQRELEEETGYTAREWKSLGWSFPNPAFLNNRVHNFLARNAERTRLPHPEDGEDLETTELTLDEIRQAMQTDRMRNSNTLLALARVFDLREEKNCVE